jgi:hypothetical protein
MSEVLEVSGILIIYPRRIQWNTTFGLTAYTAIRRNLPTMLNEEAIAEHYERTITENPDFVKDLLRSYVNSPVFRHCYTCGSHQTMETLQVRCKHCKRGQ